MRDPFEGLRARFLEHCRERLVTLQEYEAGRPLKTGAGRKNLIGLAHSLAGAGGTFGFKEISQKASTLEQLLLDGGNLAPTRAALAALIDELKRTIPG
jgi:HPt (histidine-containing phosphotransfer) domain-containing protein